MKAVILAGGLGTRLSEETVSKPKPMVEIGGKPILWHIMKIYSFYGINEFIICCGYKGDYIKQYFSSYFLNQSDVTFDLTNNKIETHASRVEKWKVTLVNTGDTTMTGVRLKRVKEFIKNDDLFCFTYGDGLANINIRDLVKFHKSHKKIATLSATYPAGRFGALDIDKNNLIKKFQEKPKGDNVLINGGFFVLSPQAIDYIDGDDTIWEREPLLNLAKENQLMAYKHTGFWHPMDSLNDKKILNDMWRKNPPWKVW